MNDPRLLLDTCAIIFSALDEKIRPEAEAAISAAIDTDRIGISAVSALEIGMAMARGRLASPLKPLAFFQQFVAVAKARLCQLTPEILVNSSYLPGDVHGDPMDRILIATAREGDWTIVTRDRAILAYGAAGHVRTLAC